MKAPVLTDLTSKASVDDPAPPLEINHRHGGIGATTDRSGESGVARRVRRRRQRRHDERRCDPPAVRLEPDELLSPLLRSEHEEYHWVEEQAGRRRGEMLMAITAIQK